MNLLRTGKLLPSWTNILSISRWTGKSDLIWMEFTCRQWLPWRGREAGQWACSWPPMENHFMAGLIFLRWGGITCQPLGKSCSTLPVYGRKTGMRSWRVLENWPLICRVYWEWMLMQTFPLPGKPWRKLSWKLPAGMIGSMEAGAGLPSFLNQWRLNSCCSVPSGEINWHWIWRFMPSIPWQKGGCMMWWLAGLPGIPLMNAGLFRILRKCCTIMPSLRWFTCMGGCWPGTRRSGRCVSKPWILLPAS